MPMRDRADPVPVRAGAFQSRDTGSDLVTRDHPGQDMKARELKAVLGVLKRAGVMKYTGDGISVEFGDANRPEAPLEAGDADAPLDLPEGMLDPRDALKRINQRRQETS